MFNPLEATDPSLRYHTKPFTQGNSLSPKLDRYAKYRNNPVNLSPEKSFLPLLQNSLIYSRFQGMKRNDLGWDGVKLKQYVTEQISQGYEENRNMLEKFRKEGEENRKNRKHAHAKSIGNHSGTQIQEPQFNLPVISPRMKTEQQETEESVEEIVCRNVGVNTDLIPKKQQNKKYTSLKKKYNKMKSKYKSTVKKNTVEKKVINRIEDQLDDIRIKIDNTNFVLKRNIDDHENQKQEIRKLSERVEILEKKKAEEQERKKQKKRQKLVRFNLKTQYQQSESSDLSVDQERKPKIIYTLRKTLKNRHFPKSNFQYY